MTEDEQGYDAGSGYINVTPSFRGWDARVEQQMARSGNVAGRMFSQAFTRAAQRELGDLPLGPSRSESQRQGASSAGAFADGFKRRVKAALADLPKPKVGVDATELDAELADIRSRLAALGDITVGVDLSDTAAMAELERIGARLDELGARSPNVQVTVDAGRASAELAAFAAEVDAVGSLSPTVEVGESGIGSVIGDLASLQGLVIGLSPLVAPLAASLVGLGAGVTSVFAAAGAGAGIAALAISPVVKAVQAVTAAHTAQTKAAATAGASEVSNANQVKSAEASLAEARKNADAAAVESTHEVTQARQNLAQVEQQAATSERQAAQQVETARQAETRAHQQVTVALQAENTAREQAVRDIQDYANAAVDAHNNAEQAAITLAEAQQALTAAQTSGATGTDLEQAQLNLAQAQQAVVEANQQATRATEDNNKAKAKGVAGDPNVISAARAVTSARYEEARAVESLQQAEQRQRQAQVSGDQQIRRATQQVGTALRRQRNQQRQSAYAVTAAERSLTQAMHSQTSAAAPAAAALASEHDALQKLSPAGRMLARFITGTLLPGIHKLQRTAEIGFLPGVLAGLKAMTPLAGPITRFVHVMALAMGDLFRTLGRRLSSPWWLQFFQYVTRAAPHVLTQFVKILFNVVKGFAGLLKAFQPVTNQIGRGLLGLSRSFARFGSEQGKSSPLQRFIGYVITNGPIIGKMLLNLAKVAGQLLIGFAPLGTVMAKAIGAIAGLLAALPPAALYAIAAAIAAVVFILAGGPFALAVVIVSVAALVAKYFPQIENAFRHVGRFFQSIYHDVIKPVFDHLVTFFTKTIPNAAGATLSWVKNHWPYIAELLTGPFAPILIAITKYWSQISGVFDKAWDGIKSGASTTWTWLVKVFVTGINDVLKLLNKFIGVIDKVLGFFHLPKIPAIGLIGTGVSTPTNIPVPTGVGNGRLGFQTLAAGGRIGGGFVTRGPQAIVGEGRAQHPEYVIPTDPRHRKRAISLFQSLGGQLLGIGGIVGGIGGDISGAWHSATHFARQLAAKGIVAAMMASELPIREAANLIPLKMFQGITNGLFDRINAGVQAMIGGDSGSHSGGIGQYRPQILTALRILGLSPALAAGVLQIIAHEDGSGNPSAVNRSDSNWKAGHPSVGLMQVIRGTFASNAGPFRGVGPFMYGVSTNPLANIFAGLHYANNRYGPGMIAAGGRHDANGNYIGYDSGGILQPGLTMALNMTGKPEAVFTSGQLGALTSQGMDRGTAAAAKEILAAIREVAPGVTEGVAGEFTKAAVAHATRTTDLARKGR